MDAVEYVKQHQEVTIRRYKMAVLAAFVVGFGIFSIFANVMDIVNMRKRVMEIR